MRGPRELLFFQLVVRLHRSNCCGNSCWTHRMFEICFHKVTSILSPQKLKIRQFFCKKFVVSSRRYGDRGSWYWGFGSTVGYNLTPHYRLLDSLHVIAIFKKLAAENRGEILLIMIPPSVKHRFSKMRGRAELLFFQLVVLLHRSKRHINSFWAHRMFEISFHKVSSILSNSEAEIWINCPPQRSKSVPDDAVTESWYLGVW